MVEEKWLIDADLYDEFLTQYAEDLHEIDAPMISGAIEQCKYRLKAQPTVDAVEVVRCKDCTKWNREGRAGFLMKARCYRFTTLTGRNDFCSDGERRDGNG